MKVLNIFPTPLASVTCALLESPDTRLNSIWEKTRDAIWGERYKDAGGDEHDLRSARMVLLRNTNDKLLGRVCGGCRVIFAEDGRLLPMGAHGSVELPSVPAVEISRFFLLPEPKEECAHLLLGLVDSIEQMLVAAEYEVAYATILERLHGHLIRVGQPMVRIGENQEHCGKQFIPVKLYVRNPVEARMRYGARSRQFALLKYACAA